MKNDPILQDMGEAYSEADRIAQAAADPGSSNYFSAYQIDESHGMKRPQTVMRPEGVKRTGLTADGPDSNRYSSSIGGNYQAERPKTDFRPEDVKRPEGGMHSRIDFLPGSSQASRLLGEADLLRGGVRTSSELDQNTTADIELLSSSPQNRPNNSCRRSFQPPANTRKKATGEWPFKSSDLPVPTEIVSPFAGPIFISDPIYGHGSHQSPYTEIVIPMNSSQGASQSKEPLHKPAKSQTKKCTLEEDERARLKYLRDAHRAEHADSGAQSGAPPPRLVEVAHQFVLDATAAAAAAAELGAGNKWSGGIYTPGMLGLKYCTICRSDHPAGRCSFEFCTKCGVPHFHVTHNCAWEATETQLRTVVDSLKFLPIADEIKKGVRKTCMELVYQRMGQNKGNSKD